MSILSNIDDEWEMFVSDPTYEDKMIRDIDETPIDTDINHSNILPVISATCPEPGDIYISTKSKIAYLSRPINLGKVFWELPIMRYDTHANGIVKKQMKFNSVSQEEVDEIENNMKNEFYVVNQIMTSIRNPSGKKDWFKDVRKISVGLSMKDVTTYRDKKKCAFYNCFVIIIRIKIEDKIDNSYGTFREFHVKIFNTGKIEIPGIQTDYHLETVMEHVLMFINNIVDEPISYVGECDTILINSNFNCAFYINRDMLFDILKTKYNIQCIFDPCSYPGIQCKFYYYKPRTVQDGTRPNINHNIKDRSLVTVSFMIFRTGSILIVGMCDEHVLNIVFTFIKKLLHTEFTNICQRLATEEELSFVKKKNAKIRKRFIVFDENSPTCNQSNTIINHVTDK
jgi:hypothetical protein